VEDFIKYAQEGAMAEQLLAGSWARRSLCNGVSNCPAKLSTAGSLYLRIVSKKILKFKSHVVSLLLNEEERKRRAYG
jgi:hypothetical protein